MNFVHFDPDEDYDIRCAEIFLTPKGGMAFHCTLCEKIFDDFKKFLRHLDTEHIDLANLSNSLLDVDDTMLILLESDEDDGNSNSSDTDVESVLNIEAEDEFCETKPEKKLAFDANNYRGLKKIHELNPCRQRIKLDPRRPLYECPHCSYSCHDRSNFTNHQKRHLGKRSHMCADCGKCFFTRSEMKRHIKTHTGERPFLCHDCGRAFPSNHKLMMHIKRHKNLRDKQCTLCEKSFFSTELLNGHMSVHNDERNFKCDVCDATFKRSRTLINHKKLHENKQEYHCQLCPSSFNQNSGLNAHMRSKHKASIQIKK